MHYESNQMQANKHHRMAEAVWKVLNVNRNLTVAAQSLLKHLTALSNLAIPAEIMRKMAGDLRDIEQYVRASAPHRGSSEDPEKKNKTPTYISYPT